MGLLQENCCHSWSLPFNNRSSRTRLLLIRLCPRSIIAKLFVPFPQPPYLPILIPRISPPDSQLIPLVKARKITSSTHRPLHGGSGIEFHMALSSLSLRLAPRTFDVQGAPQDSGQGQHI